MCGVEMGKNHKECGLMLASVKDDAYKLAKSIAKEQKVTICDYISEAIRKASADGMRCQYVIKTTFEVKK